MAARATGKRARDEAAAPIRSWQDGLSVRGTARPEVTNPVSVECGTHRDRPGAKRRALAAQGRAISRGQTADGRRCWEALRVVDVRRREGTVGALDALIRWKSHDLNDPWEDTWEPVNAAGIPDRGLRDEAKAMWGARGEGNGTRKRPSGPAELPRAVTRPGGESWRGALRGRAAAVVGLARLAMDVASDEEEELRRVRLELEEAKKGMSELRRMADGACADLAAERQQSRRAKSDLKQATEYSRELEALYRAGLQNSKRS